MTPEGLVKKDILEYLSWVSSCVVFPISTIGMRGGRTSSMKLGTPDILACYHGIFLGIEVKAGKGKLSENQVKRKLEIQRAFGFFCEARALQDVIDTLKLIKDTRL